MYFFSISGFSVHIRAKSARRHLYDWNPQRLSIRIPVGKENDSGILKVSPKFQLSTEFLKNCGLDSRHLAFDKNLVNFLAHPPFPGLISQREEKPQVRGWRTISPKTDMAARVPRKWGLSRAHFTLLEARVIPGTPSGPGDRKGSPKSSQKIPGSQSWEQR